MIRPSALGPCGLAPRLAEQYPEASPATDRGTALHDEIAAVINGAGEPRSPEVQALFRAWTPPPGGMAERPMVLRDLDSDEVITAGTADFVHVDGQRGLIIDWKSGNPDNVTPAAENLQFAAYGLALALEFGLNTVEVAACFLSADGPTWDRHVLEEHALGAVMDRVHRAATRGPEAVRGPHCTGCWQRRHCPSWMLPAHEGPSALEPLTRPGGLTAENAPRALEVVLALEDALKIAKERLKDLARETDGIRVGDKLWKITTARGRKTADIAALERDGLGRYVRQGEPYERAQWVRAK